MKIKLWLSLIALTAIGFAQTTEEQIATSYRIQAKPGKDAALKAALIAHGEKFHGGANSWRIAQVISGTQEGMFQINEGPNTFAGLEERGDLGAEHMAEYDQTITPLVESRTGSNYLRFRPEYSTGTIIPKNGMKVTLRIFYLKPGRLDHLMASMNLIRNTWENLGWNVALYTTVYSGEPRVIVARRFANGFKDFSLSASAKFTAAYNKMNGAGSYEKFQENIGDDVSKVDEEIIEIIASPIKK